MTNSTVNMEMVKNYKVENMYFRSFKQTRCKTGNWNSYSGKAFEVNEIENLLSTEDKIEFLDKMYDGIISYFLELVTNYQKERDMGKLPKDKYDRVKNVSKKAWLKRHDKRGIFLTDSLGYDSNDYDLKICGKYFRNISIDDSIYECPDSKGGVRIKLTWTGNYHIVNYIFHEVIEKLLREEEKYFQEHDELSIKISKLKEKVSSYSIILNEEIFDIYYNGKTKLSIERIDKYLALYNELEETIQEFMKKAEEI